MPNLEHSLIQRWSAAAYLKVGATLMALGAAPILLYTFFGPGDGNPVGLGLWMAVAVPVGFLLVGIGTLRWVIGRVEAP